MLKNKIEEDHNIERKLQCEGQITKEMEYYAKLYEIEHYLKNDSKNVDWEFISRSLDLIAFELDIKSNIQLQLKQYCFGNLFNNKKYRTIQLNVQSV